jgi:hypothetical protein
MEGHLTIKIDGKDMPMFFGNYALEETLTHFDVSITDIGDLLSKKLLPFMRVFIYHAAAYPILKDRGIPEFTEFDVHKWIDDNGGANGELMIKCSKEAFRCLGLISGTQDEKKRTLKKSA